MESAILSNLNSCSFDSHTNMPQNKISLIPLGKKTCDLGWQFHFSFKLQLLETKKIAGYHKFKEVKI